MPFKDPEYRRQYRRKWYKENSRTEIAHVRRRKEKIRKWLDDYKRKLKCEICSESHPAIIDFHHKEGKEKESAISLMLVNGRSIDKIKEEINKCQTLCSNCHRKIHYKRKL